MKYVIMKKPDSLIFDMDGTLWDNLDSLEIVWNKGLETLGYEQRVTRDSLLGLMGKEARLLLDAIVPEASIEAQDKLFDEVLKEYVAYHPFIKPTIFDGVYEGLEKLPKKYKLFLLSNCEEGGLVNFMNHTKTTHLFDDYMEHGQNLKPKAFNLQLLKERNNLDSPIYVGDTHSDGVETRKAGMPFAFVAYGFGSTDTYDIKFDTFDELTEYFMNL